MYFRDPAGKIVRTSPHIATFQKKLYYKFNNMSAVLKIALALAAFAQGVVAFSPATRLAAPRTVVVRLSYLNSTHSCVQSHHLCG